MLHKQNVREKKSFALKNVGSGNINLGKDIAENLILLVPVLIYYASLLCVFRIIRYFCMKKYNNYVSIYVRTDCFGLTNDWDYKNVCTKKRDLKIILRKTSNQKIS